MPNVGLKLITSRLRVTFFTHLSQPGTPRDSDFNWCGLRLQRLPLRNFQLILMCSQVLESLPYTLFVCVRVCMRVCVCVLIFKERNVRRNLHIFSG